MRHYCGAQLAKSEDGENGKLENGNSLRLNGEGHNWPCGFCREKQERGHLKQDSRSPAIANDQSHFVSGLYIGVMFLCFVLGFPPPSGDLSVDINSYDRGSQEEGTADRAQEDVSCGLNGQLHRSSLEAPVTGVHQLYKVTENSLEKSHYSCDRDIVRDIEIMETADGQEAKDNSSQNLVESLNEGNQTSCSGDDEINAQVWEPPEAEDAEDELESTVACNDDEFGDGTKWGKPSSLSCCRDEGTGSYGFKDEKQKEMEEVANGKFKVIVSQLLKTAVLLSSSQGLVFKKRAAHKHMPTNYRNPRLLLIQGVLGHSSSGLSSFKSMDLEKDNMKSLMDMIEMCHPNVILVEKSVSRDVQESILSKGITLVYDMQLHRLERVARYTGSPILSSDTLAGQKLKQCGSFHVEKFLEEHAGLGEGGKQPSKTLVFIEGCPSRLGCTILLKGSHSDELKRIKYVVQIAVIMAYHLILETSFLVDWKMMFSTVILPGARDQYSSALGTGDSSVPSVEESVAKSGPSTVDIPISNGFNEEASLKKVIGNSFPLSFSVPYQSLANYFCFNGKEANDRSTEEVPVLETLEASNHCDLASKDGSNEEKLLDGRPPQSLSCSKPVDRGNDVNNNVQVQNKDGVNAVLDSQSILVLVSSWNALRETICDQSRFYHIMFYGNFDVPLGKFLQDNLLNQGSQCTTCGELPEAHFYYYAHHNKQLTIRVKWLLNLLPGEAEGKIWMWSRCGPLAAMFKNSPVTTYTVSLPPQKLEFSHRYDGLKREFENVHLKGRSLFSGIKDILKELRSQFEGSNLNLRGSLKEFSDIEDMLKEESSEFEASINYAGNKDMADYKFLSLNRLLWELLLESCIWERRLHSLLLPDHSLFCTGVKGIAVDGAFQESRVRDHLVRSSLAEDVERSSMDGLSMNRSPSPESFVKVKPNSSHSGDSSCQVDNIAFSGDLEAERTIPIASDIGNSDFVVDSGASRKVTPLHSVVSSLENSRGWFWMPFSEIRQIYMEDLERGFMPKFQSISSYIQERISAAFQLISEEGPRLHIPLGTDNYIVRDYDGELSSIIACALAVLKDIPVTWEFFNDDSRKEVAHQLIQLIVYIS
ncbi:hypothetical protein GH714_024131 [Hevea brasiliensis]|uniref:1-phosphatidylinositol-3-phosphate 5-kinase n=1 Tax=Hevea brasiliensis TaxID=3981 RepID=A0A6A6LAA5_HEVBR|nr:hypothetical protein GH714_024131 [Hevea brasiliensis]